MKNGQIAVLFRNNHYFTITKQCDRLFTLVTDQGYLHKPDIVWEELTLVGDGEFYNEEFLSREQAIKSDEDLARQLQEAEMKRATQRPEQSSVAPPRGHHQRRPDETEYYQRHDQERIRRERATSKGCDIM